MKVYINRKSVSGPWGGGAKVLDAIIHALQKHGHTVVHRLESGIDVLLCMDPRSGPDPDQVGFQNGVYSYAHGNTVMNTGLKGTTERPLIVLRVGDIGTHSKPELTQMVAAAAYHADTAVFPSQWAHDSIQHLLEMHDIRSTNQWHVIANAPAPVFYRHRDVRDGLPSSISFVTHHWSTNPKKGFAFYRKLDEWASAQGHKFTYIGRAPADFSVKEHIDVMTDYRLSEELPRHDVYVTASLEEAGANHVLEGIAAGLPVIYHRDGGSIGEYCAAFGASFDGSIESFISALDAVRANSQKLRKNIRKYRQTIDDVALKYVAIIEGLRHGRWVEEVG